MKHVFIIGAKGFTYGGYETFLDKLTEYHQSNTEIKYHIACKANGPGTTNESKLEGVKIFSDSEYEYHNAHCFKIQSPEVGSAQAIFYDIKALKYCISYIKKNNIEQPIVYVLSSRVGPVMGNYARKIHKLGGKVVHNPDGWEFRREKYIWIVRKYWKLSERLTVRAADLEICDSKNIEKYILEEYAAFKPKTTFIAYGSDVIPSKLTDDDPKYLGWLEKFNITRHNYYISVGRCVPENNFEVMIREFMESKTDKDFVIITTNNPKFIKELDQKLRFSKDKRIKFVGSIYDKELLKKIREMAYGYFHGHSVGGTNPSLLESLGSTKLNLLYNVSFNQEVAEEAALYWSLENGNLASLIDKADGLKDKDMDDFGVRAKRRINDSYSWKHIADKYVEVFVYR